jgi:hypothetical protein
MGAKKLYQVIKEKQIIAVLLSESLENCGQYLLEHKLVEDLEYVSILEVSKQDREEEGNVIPLMIAKKSMWYDLRHHKHLYIYESS